MLAALGEAWEDVPVRKKDGSFAALQDEGPGVLAFGSVPLLEDGDLKLVQGPVITSYLARKHGRVDPTDVSLAARADAVNLGAEDLRIQYFRLFGGEDAPRRQADFVTGRWSERWLPRLEGLLELEGTGWFVGDDWTHADIGIFDALDATLEWVEGATLDGAPNLAAFMDRVRALPGVGDYFASDRRVYA